MFIPCVIGYGQLLIIVLVVLLLFGGRKIPELMRGLGRGVKEFKDAVNKDYSAEENQANRKNDSSGKESEK
ncbi:twin-arginine translocase TatA/TatE family subunit [Alistipes sp. An54]|uniref:twin-arginine translocase TatA/TatE family subunit n=1 Tax=Alistipes TaxID=239759 RepID=UPI000B3A9A7E|nr:MULTISPECIES: twin-arginine translocase TatA/TatE family subunit [Alistipes]OUN76290.1 twin-arginine translocase TatA/TatE family subunit [Alistipes sp. An54]